VILTLAFNLVTLEVDPFMPLFRGPFAPFGIKIGSFVFTILLTDERSDEPTDSLRTIYLRLPVWPEAGIKISST